MVDKIVIKICNTKLKEDKSKDMKGENILDQWETEKNFFKSLVSM